MEEDPPTTPVRGQVANTDGEVVPGSRVVSADSGVDARADLMGRIELIGPADRCHFRAERQDGLVFTWSEWEPFDISTSARIDILIELTAAWASGLGVTVDRRSAL